ncbi:uncharacterized protein [Periplaneta americana]|uniref:uncharacterized protein n=1 Tax=Periplaneta americana TaxID=6978 RepID=UPI0037E908A6
MIQIMAAESDGVLGMVSGPGDEQPMDLSRPSRKATRLVPALIPISLLRSGYHHRRVPNKDTAGTKRVALPSQISLVNNESEETVPERLQESTKDDDWRDHQVSPKRSRLGSGDNWGGAPRLDRARSVPQLTPLPSLQRHKSLSESRIPVATLEANAHDESWGLDSPPDHLSEEDLRQRLQLTDSNGALLKSSWIYIGYYSQLLHRFQAQELLRQFALQHQRESQDDKVEGTAASATSKAPNVSEDACDIKRRQTRPLTGKHVRPGTGASPATLLSLRRKIQARQQQHDAQQLQK